MAIDHCKSHDLEWNRDDYTECPLCVMQGRSTVAPLEMRAPVAVPIADKPADLLREMYERFPWQAETNDLAKRVQRAIGEA